MSAQKDCNMRCQSYKGGEVKHWRDCKYYPGSLSEKLNTAAQGLKDASSDLLVNASIGNVEGVRTNIREVLNFIEPK